MNPLRQTLPLLALSAAVVLAGCAAMSQEECRTADWGEQGMRDALDGYPRSRLADIREACAKAGVAPIESLYWNGWNAGITRFCTPENGERWGREGRGYHNSCPPQIEAGFLDRYRAGRRVHDAEQVLEQLQREQDRVQWRLNAERDEARRQWLRASLRDLDLRLAMARDDLARAEWRLRTGR